MPRERRRPTRKRRTREHIIADLGVHHVEGPILRCGFTAERVVHDYGTDLRMQTYDANGELENDYVPIQVKATDHVKMMADGSAVVFRIERPDLVIWMEETFPLILVVYDAQTDVGYWLYVQSHFAAPRGELGTGQTLTVHIPVANVLNEAAIRRFAEAKAAIQEKLRGTFHHD